jgi:hypothetical protein
VNAGNWISLAGVIIAGVSAMIAKHEALDQLRREIEELAKD